MFHNQIMSRNIGADCCVIRKMPQTVFMNSRLLDLFTLSVTLRCLIKTEERNFRISPRRRTDICPRASFINRRIYNMVGYHNLKCIERKRGRERERERESLI